MYLFLKWLVKYYYQLSSQGWIPIFQANNGSGLDVYNAWNSSNFNITTMEGPSPLKTQQAIWQIIKEVIIYRHDIRREYCFNHSTLTSHMFPAQLTK